MNTATQTVDAYLDFLMQVLTDLADKLRETYDDVDIKVSISAR